MTCPHCNRPNPYSARTCLYCGKPLPKSGTKANTRNVDARPSKCPLCREPLKDGAAVCPHCKARVMTLRTVEKNRICASVTMWISLLGAMFNLYIDMRGTILGEPTGFEFGSAIFFLIGMAVAGWWRKKMSDYEKQLREVT